MRIATALTATALLAAPAMAQEISPEQAKIIASDPAFAPQKLRLTNLPAATGPSRALFNGKDLAGWSYWLGYADPRVTFTRNDATPIGTGQPIETAFTVVTIDGGPAIRGGGPIWGSLILDESLADYHLTLEYRWGDAIWPPAEAEKRNSGLIYHSFGPPGGVFGTWWPGIEFQLQHGSNGMAIASGAGARATLWVGQDKTLPYPYRRMFIGGRQIELGGGLAWNVEAAVDAEKPIGGWNRIELYVVGDRAIHVVNGVPVNQLFNLKGPGTQGEGAPLTSGSIQLQSEGAEIFFRNIMVAPIKRLPNVVAQD